MFPRIDPRRTARLTVPHEFCDGALQHHCSHILDLSLLGARIRHQEVLHEGVVCYLDLPPALGALRLTGRLAWTRLHDTEQTLEGERRSHYESGIEFTKLTSEQQAALAAVLAKLHATQTEPGGGVVP